MAPGVGSVDMANDDDTAPEGTIPLSRARRHHLSRSRDRNLRWPPEPALPGRAKRAFDVELCDLGLVGRPARGRGGQVLLTGIESAGEVAIRRR